MRQKTTQVQRTLINRYVAESFNNPLNCFLLSEGVSIEAFCFSGLNRDTKWPVVHKSHPCFQKMVSLQCQLREPFMQWTERMSQFGLWTSLDIFVRAVGICLAKIPFRGIFIYPFFHRIWKITSFFRKFAKNFTIIPKLI